MASNKYLQTAVKAAKAAGLIVRKNFHHIKKIDVKGKRDFVTNVDKEVEKKIISILKKDFPSHSILAEESGKSGKSDYKWIIDPIDGTTNFIKSIPFFNTSIALQYKDKIIVGVVYNAILDEMFYTVKGKGAFLKSDSKVVKIHVSSISKMKDSFITYCNQGDDKSVKQVIKYFNKLKPVALDARKLGAAALELAYVASGRVEAYLSAGTYAWDVAAGCLLVEEAGGKVTDINGKDWMKHPEGILATNGKIHSRLLKMIR